MSQAREIYAPGFKFDGPLISFDPAINQGTLALLEPGHPAFPTEGVPLISVKNIASETANALRPGAGSDWAVDVQNPDGIWSLSRTSKGGLKGTPNNSITQTTENRWAVAAPGAFNSYLDSKRGNLIYLSVIYTQRTTRTIPTGGDYLAVLGPLSGPGREHVVYSSANSGNAIQSQAGPGAVGTSTGVTIPANGQPMLLSVATADTTTAITAAKALFFRALIHASGNIPAGIHYRVVVEDLTVSGLSYLDAHSRDAETMSKLFAPGGRYYGDA